MGFLDYFRHVPTWTTDDVRRYLQETPPGKVHLIDVRQPREYDRGHLPGASLVPIAELEERLPEFDRGRRIIVYCDSGLRSEAAAGILRRYGFRQVAVMEGGYRSWEGLVARGRPEMVMTWFFSAHDAEEYIALAWYLEEGTREFYARLADDLEEPAARGLFAELARAEIEHEELLLKAFAEVHGAPAGAGFPRDIIELGPREEEFMEGGLPFGKALAWSRGRSLREILELTAGMETSAYDRYLFMHDHLEEVSVRHVFQALAKAEKHHLRRVTGYLDKLLEAESGEEMQAEAVDAVGDGTDKSGG